MTEPKPQLNPVDTAPPEDAPAEVRTRYFEGVIDDAFASGEDPMAQYMDLLRRDRVEGDGSYASFYRDPVGTARYREADGFPPIDAQRFQDWVGNLTPVERAYLELEKMSVEQQASDAETAHEKLTKEVPALYEARLPAQLAGELGEMDYAIGFNQTMAGSVDEAREYLDDNGGVVTTGYNLDQRFLIYDQDMDEYMLGPQNPQGIAGAIEVGYTGDASIGRFVAVFPVAHPEERRPQEALSFEVNMNKPILPDDLMVESPGDTQRQEAVSNKYIAGFIDDRAQFWANQNFMKGSDVVFKRLGEESPWLGE